MSSASSLEALSTPPAFGVAPVAQFYIPASGSLQERRPRTLKHDDTFAVFDHIGDALSGPGSPEGIYHRDTRYLSHLSLTLDGLRPILLSSTLRDDNGTLTCDLTNPDVFDAGGRMVLGHDLIHVRRSRFLWQGSCYERIMVRNFDDRPQTVSMEIAYAADFADLFEVRGTHRARKGQMRPPDIRDDGVVLGYVGLDGKPRATNIVFDPAPLEIDSSVAHFEFRLAPQAGQSMFMRIDFDRAKPTRLDFKTFIFGLRAARRALRTASSRATAISTSNEVFNELAQRSISDLYMLVTDTPEGPYPYAGIPWYSTVFGRDALITAFETLWLDPSIARGVLRHLAANQAQSVDPAADAEPGKILHEVRYGEMAELGEVPFRRYYGSVDSTPLFVWLAGEYLGRTGDVATVRQIWPNIEAALTWIDEYGDRDGDGFVEYGRQTDEGLINQGWKDSHDSIFHADGALARGPIALAEVQAYVYGAWQAAADILLLFGERERAMSFVARAEGLRKAFDDSFFDEDLGTYVLALDGAKKPCRVRSSNAGHVLLTDLAFEERASTVVRTLMKVSSFGGWGIRTIPSTEIRYNPMSYHNGSVWPHDNALIAAGMARYRYREDVGRIFEGLFGASTYIDMRRLPELFCGFPRQRAQGPTFYPVACSPQAWAAATPLSLLQSCLGLSFKPSRNEILFKEPYLPAFLDEVVLNRLCLNGQSADVAIRRSRRNVVIDVLERRGDMKIVTVA